MAISTEQKTLEWLLKLREPIKKAFTGVRNEVLNTFDIGLSKYIFDREKKLSKINTFISRDKKVDFYKVYFTQTLRSNKRQCKSDNILENLFTSSNAVAIVASAGSGKTMLMKHIFLSCKNELFKIPIFIELRYFNNKSFSIFDYIYSYVLNNKIKPSEKILEKALQSGKFLLLFDGYDELSQSQQVDILNEVQSFIDIYPENSFIFSSRPGTGIEYSPRIEKWSIQDLNEKEIQSFIDKQSFLLGDKVLAEKLKDQIVTLKNSSYSNYLKNPLLLSMFILTYKDYPEIPRTKSKFYFNVFDTLTVKHNSVSKRGGFVHPRKTNLQFEDFEKILQAFSFITLLDNQFTFSRQYIKSKLQDTKKLTSLKFDIDDLLYDLQVCIAIITEDGDQFAFPHRTLQDYFAASYIQILDSESKSTLYKDYITKTTHLHSNFSFLSLCKELDEAIFCENYLLPLYRMIPSLFSGTAIENALKLLDMFRASFSLAILQEDDRNVRFRIKLSSIGFRHPIASVLFLEGYGPFKWNLGTEFGYSKNAKICKWLKSVCDKNGFTLLDFNSLPKEFVEPLIKRSGLLTNITSFILEIKGLEEKAEKNYNLSRSKVKAIMDLIQKNQH